MKRFHNCDDLAGSVTRAGLFLRRGRRGGSAGVDILRIGPLAFVFADAYDPRGLVDRKESIMIAFQSRAAESLRSYADVYLDELTGNVVPFWEKHAIDRQCGGYFNCLDRDGAIYDTDKYMWMQWRIVYTFCELHEKLEKRTAWLDHAQHGYDFLTKHGRDAHGRYYFAMNRRGEPTMAPYSIFSESFAAMGAAALYRATGDPKMKAESLAAFERYLGRMDRPKMEWTKEMPGMASMKALGASMILANMAFVLDECLGGDLLGRYAPAAMHAVLADFWNPTYGVLFENVRSDGTFDLETMAGRHLCPGHGIEALWFIMVCAMRTNDRDAIASAAAKIQSIIDFAWDKEFGGIYYFMDVLGKPHIELQWNMKLWWVHNETLIALVLAYLLTGDASFRTRFEQVHEWTWQRFPDRAFGEWFAYLDRRGEPTHLLKGGKWKCFYHLPRMLLTIGTWLRDTK
jgi:N-acylglucosamine 2-epimerase